MRGGGIGVDFINPLRTGDTLVLIQWISQKWLSNETNIQWLVIYSAPRHYRNLMWLINNCTITIKHYWHLHKKKHFHWIKFIWNCRLQYVRHFFPGINMLLEGSSNGNDEICITEAQRPSNRLPSRPWKIRLFRYIERSKGSHTDCLYVLAISPISPLNRLREYPKAIRGDAWVQFQSDDSGHSQPMRGYVTCVTSSLIGRDRSHVARYNKKNFHPCLNVRLNIYIYIYMIWCLQMENCMTVYHPLTLSL